MGYMIDDGKEEKECVKVLVSMVGTFLLALPATGERTQSHGGGGGGGGGSKVNQAY